MGLLIFAASTDAMSLRAAVKDEAVPWPEISEQEREGLDFVYADDIGDVLKVALETDGKRPSG